MKRVSHIIPALFLCGVLGCASADSDRKNFDRIGETLEKGGSTYIISSSRNAGAALEKQLRKCEETLWLTDLPTEKKFKLQHLLSSGELVFRLAGFHEINGWGASSVSLPGREKLFRNKVRLLLPPQPKGFLWHLLSENTSSLQNCLSDLPSDTFFAGAVNIRPRALISLLNADPEISRTAANLCKLLLDMTPEELLSTLSGVWRLVLVCDEENDTETLAGIHIALTVPDKENRLFKTLSQKLKILPNSRVNLKSGTIKLDKLPGKLCTPFICRGKDTISICTTPTAAVRTGANRSNFGKKLPIDTLSQLTDLKGAGVFFSRNTAPCKVFSTSIDMTPPNASLAVLKKLPDGFLLEDISAGDLSEYAVRTLAAVPLQQLFELFSQPDPRQPQASRQPQEPRKSLPPAQVQPPRPKAEKKPAVKKQLQCAQAIERLGRIIVKEAKHSGEWPLSGIAGIRSLAEKKLLTPEMLVCPSHKLKTQKTVGINYANCDFLYFGKGAPDSPKTPLLMEIPVLHREYFAVFYADGTVKKIQLDGRRNVRRAVSFLHTEHSYEEQEFMRLMQLASEFDKILEL